MPRYPSRPWSGRSRAGVLLLAAALLAGGWSAPLAAQQLREGCEKLTPRAETPSITGVLDTAALEAELSGIVFLREGGRDSAIVYVSYDSTGALQRTGFSHRAAPAAVSDHLDGVIRRHAAPTAEPLFSAYGLISRGETVRVHALVVQWQCEPRLKNQAALARALRRSPQTHGARAVVWLLLGADGGIHDLKVERSSGSVPADAAFLEVARLAILEPASINGYPVPVWISLPLQATVRRRR